MAIGTGSSQCLPTELLLLVLMVSLFAFALPARPQDLEAHDSSSF